MIKCNSQYPSRVNYVKHKENDRGAVTTFSIGDKIKDAPPIDGKAQYVNYTVTVYEHLDINDGDEVTLTSIDSLSVREYNGKVYRDIVARVTVNNAVQPAHQEPQWGNASSENLPFEL